ncbi:hypothetical protein KHU50_010508 [Colletotrichum sp. SAR 10_65]|nr:hypothetical protein KHU50_010508 [Colletotrichum sp. SAR 10_65]
MQQRLGDWKQKYKGMLEDGFSARKTIHSISFNFTLRVMFRLSPTALFPTATRPQQASGLWVSRPYYLISGV